MPFLPGWEQKVAPDTPKQTKRTQEGIAKLMKDDNMVFPKSTTSYQPGKQFMNKIFISVGFCLLSFVFVFAFSSTATAQSKPVLVIPSKGKKGPKSSTTKQKKKAFALPVCSKAVLKVPQAPTLLVSWKGIIVQSRKIVSLQKDGRVSARFKKGNNKYSLLIEPLYKRLKEEVIKTQKLSKYNKNIVFTGRLNIRMDKNLPFRLFSEILYTAGQAGFDKYTLSVCRRYKSSSVKKNAKHLLIELNKKAIVVNGRTVLSLQNGMIPSKALKTVAPNTTMIAPLHKYLQGEVKRLKSLAKKNASYTFEGKIGLRGAKALPFRLLSQVIFTAQQAGFGRFSFTPLTSGGCGEKVLPLRVPMLRPKKKGKKVTLNLTVIVNKSGFLVKSRGGNFPKNCELNPTALQKPRPKITLPMKGGSYDYKGLHTCLRRVKSLFRSEQKIIIYMEAGIPLQILVNVYSANFSNNLGNVIFPDVLISAGIL